MENVGLRQFKQGWGAEEYRIKYFKYDLNADAVIRDNADHMDFMLRFVFSKMPISISQILGAWFYRYFG
jgi:hypothetical protein